MQYTVVLLNSNSDNGSYDVVRVEAANPDEAYATACRENRGGGGHVDDYCGGPVFAGWSVELPVHDD